MTANFAIEISVFVIKMRRDAPEILLEMPNFLKKIIKFIIKKGARSAQNFENCFISYRKIMTPPIRTLKKP